MKNKIDFSTLVKRMTNFNHGIKNQQIMHPTRDWFVGLFMGLIIFGVSATWSAFVYIEYKNTSVDEAVEETNEVLYRKLQVEDALEYFRTKNKTYSSLINSESNLVMNEVDSKPNDESNEETVPEDPEQPVEAGVVETGSAAEEEKIETPEVATEGVVSEITESQSESESSELDIQVY